MPRRPTGGPAGRPTLAELRRREADLTRREAELRARETAPPPLPDPPVAPARPPAAADPPAAGGGGDVAPPAPSSPPADPPSAATVAAAPSPAPPARGLPQVLDLATLPRVRDESPLVAFQAPAPADLPPLPGPLVLSDAQRGALADLAARQAAAAAPPPPPPAPPAPKSPADLRLERKLDKAILAFPHALESVVVAKVAGCSWKDSIFKTAPTADDILEEEADLLGPTLDRWLGDHREKVKWILYVRCHARHIGNALVDAERLAAARPAAAAPPAAPPADPTAGLKRTLADPPREVAPAAPPSDRGDDLGGGGPL